MERSGSVADVYASWSGATEVTTWRVLGGRDPKRLSPMGRAPKMGFETRIALTRAPAYVAVEALDSDGATLGRSRVLRV